jgi:hypothetical protein
MNIRRVTDNRMKIGVSTILSMVALTFSAFAAAPPQATGGAVTKQPLAILQGDTPSESGVHGKGNVYAHDVCVVDGLWRMLYDGRADLPPDAPATGVPKSPTSRRSVGNAESADGVHWQRHGREPVFQDGAGAVHVAHIGPRYLMVYESHQGTQCAVSADGLRWTARGFLLRNSGTPLDAHGQVTLFLWCEATGSEARLFFGDAREAGWDCNLICSQPIPPETLVTIQP